MTIEVIVKGRNANEIIEMVKELRALGLETGTDFDFIYVPVHTEWNPWNISESVAESPGSRFIFYNEKYATFFSLKYGCK